MNKPRNNKRSINGILLLDKPEGMTSNAALQVVKRLYNANKAGHTGSLDPLASGMLPICFGEATKFSQFLLEADKYYQVTAKLGVKTSTGDREGETIQIRAIPVITSENLQALFTQFTGVISQIPSMYSAIKHNGQPLYKFARQGIDIPREPRQVTIYELKLIEHGPDYFSFEVRSSKGTYIRTLVEDMGEVLGCGAHVSVLRRLSAGSYQPEQMHLLSHIEALQSTEPQVLDSYLLPVDSSISGWTQLSLSEAAIYYLKQGQPVIIPHAPTEGWVRLSHKNGGFVGVGEILKDGRVAPRRLVQN